MCVAAACGTPARRVPRSSAVEPAPPLAVAGPWRCVPCKCGVSTSGSGGRPAAAAAAAAAEVGRGKPTACRASVPMNRACCVILCSRKRAHTWLAWAHLAERQAPSKLGVCGCTYQHAPCREVGLSRRRVLCEQPGGATVAVASSSCILGRRCRTGGGAQPAQLNAAIALMVCGLGAVAQLAAAGSRRHRRKRLPPPLCWLLAASKSLLLTSNAHCMQCPHIAVDMSVHLRFVNCHGSCMVQEKRARQGGNGAAAWRLLSGGGGAVHGIAPCAGVSSLITADRIQGGCWQQGG